MGTLKFIWSLITWALALAYIGHLAEATHFFAKKAAYSHEHEILSLGKWQRKLNGTP